MAEQFNPGVKGEAKELALALHAVLCEQLRGKDKMAGSAALVELLAWWIRAEADQEGAPVASILKAMLDVLIQRTLQVPLASMLAASREVAQLLRPCRFCGRAFDDPRGHDREVDHVENSGG